VKAARARECPVHLEAKLESVHPLAVRDDDRRGALVALELRIVRVHVDEAIRMTGHDDRIDPEKWRPLIMSFQQFYGLGGIVHESTLSRIPETVYRPRRAAVPARAAGHTNAERGAA
jgi:flavin reductase (DIM6/NTAB) family NADH-FMN oxidoreductase RutF